MNHTIFTTHHRGGHWLKDVQFAVGVVVAIGGAAVLLNAAIQAFA
jgi:hypothetical protein